VAQAVAETEGLRPTFMPLDAVRVENTTLRVQLQDMEARLETSEATIVALEGEVSEVQQHRLRMCQANEKLHGYNLEAVDADASAHP
jgi:ribosomal protein L10